MNNLIRKYKEYPLQIRASFWFLICVFLQRGVSIITTPIFTRILSTSEYGVYSVFNAWLGVVCIFVSLNISLGVYGQGLVKYYNDRDKFSSSLQGLSLVLVVFWTIVYTLTSNFWNRLFGLTTVQMLCMLLMIWTTTAYTFWSREQRTELKYRGLIVVSVITAVMKPILGIVLVLNSQDKATARILSIALVEVIMYTGCFVYQMRKGKKFYSKKYWKYSLSFSIMLVPHFLASAILQSSDRIMINTLVGSSAAGIYNLAYSLAQIMALFNIALNQTLDPWMYQKLKENESDRIKDIAYPALIATAIINLLLIAFAPELVRVFAPIEYYDAIWVMPPIAMSVYFMFMYNFFSVFEFYYEKTKYISFATFISAILNIALNYIFIQMFGYVAAGYTTLICYILFTLLHYLFMKKICKERLAGISPYDMKKMFNISLTFMSTGFVFLFSYYSLVLRYVLIILIIILALVNRRRIVQEAKKIIFIKK